MLGACADNAWSLERRRGSGFLGLGVLRSGCANVDAPFEEGAIFDADALRNYIAGERSLIPDVHPVTGGQISLHFAELHDFPGIDVGGDLSIASHRDAISLQVDRSFDLAIDIKRFRSGYCAF